MALAERWIVESGLPEEDRLGRARHLEEQFARSGRFKYSLVGQPRDPHIDPIEDFLTNHPEGHCEYYATALTLMLRSQEIPARMVVGYKCGQADWNAVGGFYQVRQLHAHTWVEVFLRSRQIPPELMHGKDYWRSDLAHGWGYDTGGWYRLDPTPGAAVAAIPEAPWWSPLQRIQDWLDFGWSNYVVELNYRRQQEAIYQPIVRVVRACV